MGGRAAGFAAVILGLAFPELALVVRTVTAYPEMLAIWTAASGWRWEP